MEKNRCKTSIGGQAVMEGVMMRGKGAMAIAVRDADGDIRLETKRLKITKRMQRINKIPIVRGVVNFFATFVSGMHTTMRSSEVYGEAEPTKFEKWLAEKFKINLMSAIMVVALLLGVGLAVGLFILLPTFLGDVTFNLIGQNKAANAVGYSFLVGGYKILVLICYLLAVSMLKDIRRTFMYHGAEHKTISCYEQGLPLTVENVQKCSTLHNRCGTTFLFFVILISVLMFTAITALLPDIPIMQNFAVQTATRLLMLPLVAGVAYELLKFLAKNQWFIFYPLKLPGLALQKITTRQPDDSMVEVAVTAFNAVIDMEGNLDIQEVKFVTPLKPQKLIEEIKAQRSENSLLSDADIEWIVASVTGLTRSKIFEAELISARNCQKIRELCARIEGGEPLSYVLGEAEFYGYKIKVNKSVLVPRFETEYVVEKALDFIEKDSTVLDLCCGSGAIAIAVKRLKDCSVTACDISPEAVALARENARQNHADIQFYVGDLFSALPQGQKFDIIISNPPYVKSDDIDTLKQDVKSQPHLALDGGEDGLDFYRKIAAEANDYLADKGIIVLECGMGQAQDISAIFAGTGYKAADIYKDIDGVERIVVCKK